LLKVNETKKRKNQAEFLKIRGIELAILTRIFEDMDNFSGVVADMFLTRQSVNPDK
jgi:hypothetical protein